MKKIIDQPCFSPILINHYIYLLFEKHELVYLGQTVNLFSRIGSHQSDKKFDSVRGFIIDISWAAYIEQALLITSRPKYNKSVPFHEDHDQKVKIGEYFFQHAKFPPNVYGVMGHRDKVFKAFSTEDEDNSYLAQHGRRHNLISQIEWVGIHQPTTPPAPATTATTFQDS